jgi:hypothetical protein
LKSCLDLPRNCNKEAGFLALGEQLGFVGSRDFTSILENTLLQPTSALPSEGAAMYFLALGERLGFV